MFDKSRSQLELYNNYIYHPGTHTLLSPVAGSRACELHLIYEYRNYFTSFQEAIYSNQRLNIIPIEYKEKADKISKGILAHYIKKYADAEITLENAVSWTQIGLTRTYLSDLENEWNTWCVQAIVSEIGSDTHISEGKYRPGYICALHELMHVEETPLGISRQEYEKYKDVVEVLTVTRTLILLDEVYKKTLDIPMDYIADYDNNFNLNGYVISQGKFANFYRALETKYGSLAEALVSDESLTFLGFPLHQYPDISMHVVREFMAVSGAVAILAGIVLLCFFSIPPLGALALVAGGAVLTLIGIGLFSSERKKESVESRMQNLEVPSLGGPSI